MRGRKKEREKRGRVIFGSRGEKGEEGIVFERKKGVGCGHEQAKGGGEKKFGLQKTNVERKKGGSFFLSSRRRVA